MKDDYSQHCPQDITYQVGEGRTSCRQVDLKEFYSKTDSPTQKDSN